MKYYNLARIIDLKQMVLVEGKIECRSSGLTGGRIDEVLENS